MKTFIIEFDHENGSRQCFVQQIDAKPNEIFLLTFKDACLIQYFKGKRMMLSSADINAENKDGVIGKAWTAIRQKIH